MQVLAEAELSVLLAAVDDASLAVPVQLDVAAVELHDALAAVHCQWALAAVHAAGLAEVGGPGCELLYALDEHLLYLADLAHLVGEVHSLLELLHLV